MTHDDDEQHDGFEVFATRDQAGDQRPALDALLADTAERYTRDREARRQRSA